MVDGNAVDAYPAGGGGTGAASGRTQFHQLSELREESDERCFDDEILGATITASSMMAFSLTKHDGDSSVVKESDDDNTKDPRGAHPPRQVSLLSMGESSLGLGDEPRPHRRGSSMRSCDVNYNSDSSIVNIFRPRNEDATTMTRRVSFAANLKESASFGDNPSETNASEDPS